MDNKEILKMMIKPLTFIVLLFTIISQLKVRGYFTYMFIIIFLQMFFDFLPTLQENAKKYLISGVIVLAFVTILKFLGGYGILGFILSILLLVAWRIWKARQIFMASIRNIEKMIFGKSLDKKEDEEQWVEINANESQKETQQRDL